MPHRLFNSAFFRLIKMFYKANKWNLIDSRLAFSRSLALAAFCFAAIACSRDVSHESSMTGVPLSQRIDWETTSGAYEAAADQAEVLVEFPFTNTGSEPLTIAGIKTDCDCTLIGQPAQIIQPSESGSIQATFVVGERFGLNERTLHVSFSGYDEPVELAFAVFVPEPITTSKRLVEWPQGSEPVPQSITLEAGEGRTLQLKDIRLTNDAFSYEVIEKEPGRVFELRVMPQDMLTPRSTQLIIQTNQAPLSWSRLVFMLRVI